ncbi:MAG: class I SAM-dependent rRNA methyltransferase [Endomicrobiia bacterium]
MKINHLFTTKQYKNRIENGYLWIFSNEIKKEDAPKEIGYVELYDDKNRFLCKGVYNPYSLIALRVLSVDKNEKINKDFFINKIKMALNLRKSLGINTEYCRLVYGESDYLPGVVIDRYGDVFVLQFYSYGMEIFKEEIINALLDIFSVSCIIIRNDFYHRDIEKAPQNKEVVFCKEKNFNFLVKITHFNCEFVVDVFNGQKTGFYYDQLSNREFISKIVKDKVVLDLCCYTGGFGIIAGISGAKKVIGIDSSSYAIQLAKENSRLNNLEGKVEFIQEDVEKFLEKNKEKFDIVIYDPPSFTKSKKDKKSAIKKYKNMVKNLLKITKKDGIFNFSVCSRHLTEEEINKIIIECMLKNRQKGFIIYSGTQSLDHPIYGCMFEETKYLKFISVLIG